MKEEIVIIGRGITYIGGGCKCVCVNYTIHVHVNYTMYLYLTMYVQELRGNESSTRGYIISHYVCVQELRGNESSTRGYIISYLELMQLCLIWVVTGANTEGGRAR